VFAQFFTTLRSVFFGAEQSQSDSHGVSLNCAVLLQKISAP